MTSSASTPPFSEPRPTHAPVTAEPSTREPRLSPSQAKPENCGYLTIEEAAQLARCNPSTLRRAIGSGALASFRPAQRLLFRESDVRDWIESRPAVRERPRPRRVSKRRAPAGSVQSLREIERNLSS